jgi:hypothetical protein
MRHLPRFRMSITFTLSADACPVGCPSNPVANLATRR